MTVSANRVAHTSQDAGRVSIEFNGPVAAVWLGAGMRRNALRTGDWLKLEQLLERLGQRPEVTVVVFRGVQGSFSSGSDLTEWVAADAQYVNRTFAVMESTLAALEGLDAVSIAAIEGAATGAGCELTLACDLRIMARSARIGMPVIQHGIRISPTFVLRLVEVAGVTLARDLLFTGRLIDADRAEQWGLVSRVVDDDAFESELTSLVGSVSSLPASGLVAAKRSTNRALERNRVQLRDASWRYVDDEEFFDRISAFLSH